jgi:hypothetical protein
MKEQKSLRDEWEQLIAETAEEAKTNPELRKELDELPPLEERIEDLIL